MVQKSIFQSWTDRKSRIKFRKMGKIDFLMTDLIDYWLIEKKLGPLMSPTIWFCAQRNRITVCKTHVDATCIGMFIIWNTQH